MKKIFALMFVILIMSSTCLAMTFFQPVKIGRVGGTPQGGFWIEGASYNNGTSYENGKLDREWGKLYEKGVAIFGNGIDAIYMHYDCSNTSSSRDPYRPKFGDKNATRSVSLGANEGEAVNISLIKNDSNITLYLLHGEGSAAGTENYILLGRRSDGIFVKYFDTRDITKNYFGENLNLSNRPWYTNFYCHGSIMIIKYKRNHTRQGYLAEGEFRFKWDDKAQWFGIQQVVY